MISQTLAGHFSAADVNLKGLVSLVEARGGIGTLKDNFIIERAVTWSVHDSDLRSVFHC